MSVCPTTGTYSPEYRFRCLARHVCHIVGREARQLWIGQVHLNQLSHLLNQRLQKAETIRSDVSEMMNAGEVGPFEYSQANLMVASIESEFEEVLSELENNRLALLQMTEL